MNRSRRPVVRGHLSAGALREGGIPAAAGRRRISALLSVVRSLLSAAQPQLLHDFLKLLTDYRSVEAIDGECLPRRSLSEGG